MGEAETRQTSAMLASQLERGAVVFPKFAGRAREQGCHGELKNRLHPHDVFLGDFARRPDEDHVRSNLLKCGYRRCVFVLPGTTIPGGCQKDRRRAASTASLCSELCDHGTVCFLCIPRSSPTLHIPEVQSLRRHPHCQVGQVDLCAIGATVHSSAGVVAMRKQYIVFVVSKDNVELRSLFATCSCAAGCRHECEQTMDQPRPSMLHLAGYLLNFPLVPSVSLAVVSK
eukprot:6464251-Amphidinium_carterae.2